MDVAAAVAHQAERGLVGPVQVEESGCCRVELPLTPPKLVVLANVTVQGFPLDLV